MANTVILRSHLDPSLIARVIATTSANITLAAATATDYVSICTGNATYITTLPTAVGNTNRYTIKNASTANQTVAFNGTETADGSTTLSLTPNTSIDLVSNNATWVVV